MAEQSLIENCLLKLESYALQRTGQAFGLKKELTKLENSLSATRAILPDVQERKTRLDLVENWSKNLKLVIYDAVDLLDELATEDLRRRVDFDGPIGMVKEVCFFFTLSRNPIKFRWDLGRRLKNILDKLDFLASYTRSFGFCSPDRSPSERFASPFLSADNQTILGRKNDKERLTKLLICSTSTDEENVHIIPILGMVGIGKSTLVKLVYNDPWIAGHFSSLFWVPMSKDFDIHRILHSLLIGEGYDHGDDDYAILEQLQSRVRELLSYQRFFLVLENVRNVDLVEWKKLLDLLVLGARGSRVVVTTPSRTVASMVCTSEPLEIKGLSNDDCLAILTKHAFQIGDEDKHKSLLNIGKEIVEKCGGVPLVAKSLGGVLRCKNGEHEWLRVRDNEMYYFEYYGQVLLESYDQMPSYLKQCFAYCSVFQKDQLIEKDQLIYGWLAQGFLQHYGSKEEFEDTGEVYIDELVRRSFLEEPVTGKYKMHSLVYSLAKYVASSEYSTISREICQVDLVRTLHVSLDLSAYCEYPSPLTQPDKLRTLILLGEMESFQSFSEAVISRCKVLRVLDISRRGWEDGHNKGRAVLPRTIGNLQHLRYLSFHGAEKIPESLCKLKNLQYLDLFGSVFCELPRDFGKLINLRFLCLSSNLTCLPNKGIGGLTSLRVLLLYGNNELRSLGEGIQYLTCLRKLVILGCPKLASLPAGFRYLTNLEHLEIVQCVNFKFSEDDLKGLRRLKVLILFYLPELVSLPRSLQDAAASLSHLRLWYCTKLRTLSESILPNLNALQVLEIEACDNLVSLPEGTQCITTLRRLTITDSDHLSRRCKEGIGEDWSKIAHVPEICIDGRNINSIRRTRYA